MLLNLKIYLSSSNTDGYLYRKQILMVSKVSEGVSISVETFYQPENSNPQQGEYLFAYRITIENMNSFAIQLLRRHWNIFDSCGDNREVDGEGVVGEQPILNQGEQYQYVSNCNLKSEMGKMSGTYTMENLNTKQHFEVNIPPFDLIVPNKMN
jgi:ApaG protein